MTDALRHALAEGQRRGAAYTLVSPERTRSGLVGARLGDKPGSSIEFLDHRDYQPGDDLRRLDWAAYARSDRLIVRLYREEVCPHLDLVLDASASMALEGTRKAEAAAALCAALATAAGNASFTHALWRAADGLTRAPGGELRPDAWEPLAFDSDHTLADAVLGPGASGGGRFRGMTVRVLISDLLTPDEPTPVVTRLADGAAGLFVIQLLAQQDATPPEHGSLRLVDAETQAVREVFLDAAARRRYAANLARHQDAWQRACRAAGARMTTLIAEDLLDGWDLTELLTLELLRL